ncbi:hypothetical protein Fmac_027635 [Flemingia macrophylla]|uniref:Senescence regulator n=1 Tax=Flemingia macrophylla TaxID=520843 RepID=A0ABD1LIH1_9FABA
MASRKNFLSKQSRYIYPATSDRHLSPTEEEGMFEFDEAGLWNKHSSEGTKKGLPLAKRSSRNKQVDDDDGGRRIMGPASLPVNIPDWSKILKEDYKEHRKWESGDDDDDEYEEEEDEENRGGIIRVPPHEYLARTRGASLSVHEGIGRTLKGRDLRSVRNAIWKKVGFED